MTDASDLGSILRKRGLTKAELARRIGVSAQYVSQITNGKRVPTGKTLEAIESALHLAPGSLDSVRKGGDRIRSRPASLAGMEGVEIAYLKNAMDALREARRVLLRKSPSEALRAAAGKRDTRMFDAITESTIVHSLRSFSERCAIFTEETNVPDRREYAELACYFVDPLDRSRPFAESLKSSMGHESIGELVMDSQYKLRGLEAPVGSISLVRHSVITFNVMIEYSTGEMYVACRAMLKHANCDKCPDPDAMAADGRDIRFDAREGTDFICFIGEDESERRTLYDRHLQDLEFLPGRAPRKAFQAPGGPMRILYLADDSQLVPGPRVACILSNGEKICEWFGWLAYVAHSMDLTAYDLYAERFSGRDQILVAPPPNYSLFSVSEPDGCKLNMDRITVLNTPVRYRGALVVTAIGSTEIIAEMEAAMRCRELRLSHRG